MVLAPPPSSLQPALHGNVASAYLSTIQAATLLRTDLNNDINHVMSDNALISEKPNIFKFVLVAISFI